MNNENGTSQSYLSLDAMRKKLLDLSLRNRLINFRHTKNATLRVIDELPNQLIETLLADSVMNFKAIPRPTQDQLLRAGYIMTDKETGQPKRMRKDPTAEEWAKFLGFNTSYQVPIVTENDNFKKHTDKYIQTLLFPEELEHRLRNLRQKAELVIEESGTNILYLSIGFLEWFEHKNSEISHLAPLILVPVRLQKAQLNNRTNTYDYSLTYSGEDILPNLSLREKLKIDFGIALPDFDEETLPETYFETVLNMSRINKPRWRVRRYITMGLLNFSKLLMYLDLDPNRWPNNRKITKHRVVSQFLGEYESPNSDNVQKQRPHFEQEHPIDEIKVIHEKYPLIDDADSSQHSALIDAVDGKDLVIEGPPGSGKSQTITNLIAAAMSQGKTVLFVAEKLAALQVVKRRLDAAGLGIFCLELHSHKSQKRKVLDDINDRFKQHGHFRHPKDIEADIRRLEELKRRLKEYAERINTTWKSTGKTLHEIIVTATRYREELRDNPNTYHPEGISGNNFDANMQRRLQDQMYNFIDICNAIQNQIGNNRNLRLHPWCGVKNTDLDIFETDKVTNLLKKWQMVLEQIYAFLQKIQQTKEYHTDKPITSIKSLEQMVVDINQLSSLHGDELLETLPKLRGNVLTYVINLFKLFQSIQNRYRNLSKMINTTILEHLKFDRFSVRLENLQTIFESSVDLNTIENTIRSLELLAKDLTPIENLLPNIHKAIDDPASSYLTLTVNGLQEFETFLTIVESLSINLWNHRNPLFENKELDQILPRIKQELEILSKQRKQLSQYFKIERLPDQKSLERLYKITAFSGPLKWIKPNWWSARKEILSYSSNSQIKFNKLEKHLQDTILFLERLYNFENNNEIRTTLGTYAQGLNTKIDMLISLRKWYRLIRKTYGRGFAAKVEMANALITLSVDTADAIQSVIDQGIKTQIQKCMNNVFELRKIFPNYRDLQSNTMILTVYVF